MFKDSNVEKQPCISKRMRNFLLVYEREKKISTRMIPDGDDVYKY